MKKTSNNIVDTTAIVFMLKDIGTRRAVGAVLNVYASLG